MSACQRALPWLEIMIADKGHLAVQALTAALAKAKGETAIERTAEDHARFSADMARIKAKGETK